MTITEPKENYQRKILQGVKDGTLGRDSDTVWVDVYHDEWCAFNLGGACNCNPDVIEHAPGTPVAPDVTVLEHAEPNGPAWRVDLRKARRPGQGEDAP
ncbi:MAG: hypothetical protein ABSF61_10745 [Anaerolineales bacterium]|jgi:hypothetical protein